MTVIISNSVLALFSAEGSREIRVCIQTAALIADRLGGEMPSTWLVGAAGDVPLVEFSAAVCPAGCDDVSEVFRVQFFLASSDVPGLDPLNRRLLRLEGDILDLAGTA